MIKEEAVKQFPIKCIKNILIIIATACLGLFNHNIFIILIA